MAGSMKGKSLWGPVRGALTTNSGQVWTIPEEMNLQRRHLRRSWLSLPTALTGGSGPRAELGLHWPLAGLSFTGWLIPDGMCSPRREGNTIPQRDFVGRQKCSCYVVPFVTGVFLASQLSAHGQQPQHECAKSSKEAVWGGQVSNMGFQQQN